MLNIIAVEIFADALGISEAAMFKQMEQGKLLAEDVLPKVARQFSKVANENGALAAATEKVNSQYQRFLSALTKAKLEMFNTQFGKASSELFKGMAELVNNVDWSAFGAMLAGITRTILMFLNGIFIPLGFISKFLPEQVFATLGFAAAWTLVVNKVMLLRVALGHVNKAMLITAARVALIAAPIIAVIDLIETLQGKNTVIGAFLGTNVRAATNKVAESASKRATETITVNNNVVVKADGDGMRSFVTATIEDVDKGKKSDQVTALGG